jgi:hypothetical protein
MNRVINGYESSILSLLATCECISKKDFIIIRSNLTEDLVDIANAIYNKDYDNKIAAGFLDWAKNIKSS